MRTAVWKSMGMPEIFRKNSISFGYASLLTRYSLRDDNLISSEGLVFSFSPELTWRGKTYMRIDQCPFFPTSAQLAASGLMWQNDQIGNLTFEENGTVHSDENADGTYDNGLLRIGGCEYLSSAFRLVRRHR